MLTLTKNTIPYQLGTIPQTQKTLYVLGDTLDNILSRPQVAIVESRRVTSYGRGVTRQIAGDLAAIGVVILI